MQSRGELFELDEEAEERLEALAAESAQTTKDIRRAANSKAADIRAAQALLDAEEGRAYNRNRRMGWRR